MSSEPWNEFGLTQPPLVTIGINKCQLPLPALRSTLQSAILCYESQKDFEESAAFCSRLLARRRNSFRNLQGYRELRKVNSALCRLLRLDIVEVLKNFVGVLPDFIKTGPFETQLPSQEHFDYVLLRVIALQKLFIRITSCCAKSASYFTKLLNKNFFIEILTAILSTIARIWKISRDLTARTASYYNEMVRHRIHFPLHRATLCVNFTFPEELDKHVANDADDGTKRVLNYSNANTDKDDSTKSPENGVSMKTTAVPAATLLKPKDADLGIVISRNSLAPERNLKDLKTLEQIVNFIKDEDTKRKKTLPECVTRKTSEQTWNLFRKKISKLPTNDNRAAVKLVKNMLSGAS